MNQDEMTRLASLQRQVAEIQAKIADQLEGSAAGKKISLDDLEISIKDVQSAAFTDRPVRHIR